MEEKNQTHILLDLMQQAAFQVENGRITHINPAAAHYCLQSGTDFLPLLATGADAYTTFTEGTLHLTLRLAGETVNATVLRSNGTEIVLPEQQANTLQLRTLELAAMELRNPLSGVMAVSNRMLPLLTDTADPQLSEYAAQMNRRMMQLQRIICNMSDCENFAQPNIRAMETVEICSLLQEILSKSAQALQHADLTLDYQLPAQQIFAQVYPQKLERAIYNMLSNAAKFSVPGGTILFQLRNRNQHLLFSVTNQGNGIANPGDAFTRYLRQPTLEDPRMGLGLGMVLIRAAATLHDGAVLLDQPDTTHTRLTMTIAHKKQTDTAVHAPILRIDYAGEQDHCLLELSDVLPATLYHF